MGGTFRSNRITVHLLGTQIFIQRVRIFACIISDQIPNDNRFRFQGNTVKVNRLSEISMSLHQLFSCPMFETD
jgi:hypothetical protein